jgi:hypothetical protein
MKSLPEELTTQIAAQEAWKQLQAIEQQFVSLKELMAQSQDQLRETFALMDQVDQMTQR